MPSATFTVKRTGFDSPAARSKGSSRGPSTRLSRESFVRASVSENVTRPASRPVEVLLTFTGICTTSPSRRNRGTTGSTIRDFADTQLSRIRPLRRLASWASPLSCQVVSVSGSVNSIVMLPSLSDASIGRKNAVSTRFFRGGGAAAAAVAVWPAGSPGPPVALSCWASLRLSPVAFRSSRRSIAIAFFARPPGAAAAAIGIASASRSDPFAIMRRPPKPPPIPPRQSPRSGEPNGSRSMR